MPPSPKGRVYLSPLSLRDTAEIRALGRDPQVFSYIPEISQPFDADSWIALVLSNRESVVRHVVRLQTSGAAIGYVQINRRRSYDWQLGYWLGKEHWGKGLGLEAAQTAIQCAQHYRAEGPIFAAAYPENTASIRILTRLGFAACDDISPLSDVRDGMIDHKRML